MENILIILWVILHEDVSMGTSMAVDIAISNVIFVIVYGDIVGGNVSDIFSKVASVI